MRKVLKTCPIVLRLAVICGVATAGELNGVSASSVTALAER
jgi:hypothetical protein